MDALLKTFRPKRQTHKADVSTRDTTDVDSLCDVDIRPTAATALNSDIEGQHDQQHDQHPRTRAPEAEWKPGKQEYFVMATLATVSLMTALDSTIVVPVLSTLALDLHGSANEAFWVGTSYLLTGAVFQPFIASLSDLFGRRALLLLSIGLFTLGTLLCAPIAKNFTVLLAGRSIQGIGGGGIITMTQVIFADMVPLRQRPKYFSFVLAAWAVGTIIGPLIGGVFAEKTTWRWCFYINFPFCGLGIVMALLSIRVESVDLSLRAKLARVDYLGAFLFVGGTTSFLMGLSWAGIQFRWSSAATLVPIFVGLLAVAAAMLYEVRWAREPFIRHGLFASRSAVVAYFGAFSQGFILLAVLYYITFYFTAVRFHSPIRCGVDLLPISVCFVPASVVVSALCTRLGRFRWAVWGGWATLSLGSGLYLLWDENTPTAVWATSISIAGIGTGMVLTSINVAIQAISRAEDSGRAAAMYAFVRALGMSIGVAVGGTTFQNVMARRLRELGLPTAIAHDAESFVHELRQLAPEDPLRVGALDAYVKGFRGVFYVVLALALTNFLLSFAIGRHSMDKPLESDFVLKRESVMANVESKRQSVRQSLLGSSAEPKTGPAVRESWISGQGNMSGKTIHEHENERTAEIA